jgi:hypothetical protein
MYDLNQSINHWKSAIAQNGTCSTDEVQELEAHLREQVADLVEAGLAEQEAFSVGLSRMGAPGDLCAEYEKVSPMRFWRRRLYTLLLAAPAVGVGVFTAIFLLPKLEHMWSEAGMGGIPGNHQWVLEIPVLILESLCRYGGYALVVAVAAVIFFDSRAASWSRFRYLPFSAIAFSVNFAVLIAITSACIAFAIVAPAFP